MIIFPSLFSESAATVDQTVSAATPIELLLASSFAGLAPALQTVRLDALLARKGKLSLIAISGRETQFRSVSELTCPRSAPVNVARQTFSAFFRNWKILKMNTLGQEPATHCPF